MMKLTAVLFVSLAAIVAASEVAAVVPQATDNQRSTIADGPDAVTIPRLLSYQGKLTDNSGNPVADTTYSVSFRLYSVASGGTAFWNETQTVRTKAGLFAVLLGSVTPIGSMPDAGAAYLGMAVAGGAELTPRLRIASTAYAYLSERAANSDLLQGRDTTTFSRSTHNHDATYVNEGQADAVTGAMLVNGTVQTADVADTTVTMAKLARAGATTGQVVKWTGSAWAPGPDNTGGGTGVTNVYQDTGITCVPNPITTTGNVKLNLSFSDARYVNEGQANSVTGAMITDGQVSSADIRDTTVNTANIKDAAITGTKINSMGATVNQVLKWTTSGWAPRNDSVGGGTGDNAWVRGAPDSVLYTANQLGIARGGSDNMLHGSQRQTHVNLGIACTTGMVSQTRSYVTVGGGANNVATGDASTIAGGWDNVASGYRSAIGGGDGNDANGERATIGGGMSNTVSGDRAVVGGGQGNRATGFGAAVTGGSGNSASGNFTAVAGGYSNAAIGDYSTAGSGHSDTVRALNGGVLSGSRNLAGDAADDTGAVVAGGYNNRATAKYAFVGGGQSDTASGNWSTVGGGRGNAAETTCATIGGGSGNLATGPSATVAGGGLNFASGYCATIGGGFVNVADTACATVGGGSGNEATGGYATVGGGSGNEATGSLATIGGGQDDVASGAWSTVGGGYGNHAAFNYAMVGGGYSNYAASQAATVGGGYNNEAVDYYTTVGGGYANAATGYAATVGGGYENTAAGVYSMVAGGQGCHASGSSSLAAGTYARARGAGSFVWSDSCGAADSVRTTTDNCWLARARGGVYFYTNLSRSTGSYLSPGGSSWQSVSDSMTKENFRPVDKEALLDALARMRVRDYNLKSQDAAIRHIGPVAQDFHSAFGYGESNTAINMEDADGVLLAAVQALYDEIRADKNRIAQLEAELAQLKK
jgi:hypothetical protein